MIIPVPQSAYSQAVKIKGGTLPEFNKLSTEIFRKNFPAVTFVEVSHLARPQLIMEIQPIAVIP